MRIPSRVFGIGDFPYLKLEIRDMKAKCGRDSGLKVGLVLASHLAPVGITGLHQILGRYYGIEEPYWGFPAKWQKRLQKFHTDDALRPRPYLSKIVYKGAMISLADRH